MVRYLAGIIMILCGQVIAQTGPNSPGTVSNSTATGSNTWSSAGNALASDNVYTTVGTKGASNYLAASGFGFAIPASSNINGIQLEVEKSTLSPTSAAVLNGWTSGLSKTISAGSNRCLVVVAALENGGGITPDITAMTYGGQAMTPLTEYSTGTSFMAKLEVWYLPESGIALASGTSIVPTYSIASLTEYCEAFSVVVFQNIDQFNPVSSVQFSANDTDVNPHQLGAAITTLDGSVAVNAVMCGNNTSPASSIGGTNTYTINSSYTEGTDVYFANTGYSTSGSCLQTAHKIIATGGTEQPSCTFTGTVNRYVMIGFTLRPAREFDTSVRLIKGGTITGTEMASAALWSTSDSYAVYGGASSLWGTSWTVSEINSPSFGAAISARVQSGTARIDHLRITVYSTSTLPIELLDFTVSARDNDVDIKWITASELNSDYFVVQKSTDGYVFEDVATVQGAGNSSGLLYYGARDEHPYFGVSYYRLKQVDTDGEYEYSETKAIEYDLSRLVVFPNPTITGEINIYNTDLGVNEVAIYNSSLRLIRTRTWDQEKNAVVHIEDLPDGIYFLMIKTGKDLKMVRVLKDSRG